MPDANANVVGNEDVDVGANIVADDNPADKGLDSSGGNSGGPVGGFKKAPGLVQESSIVDLLTEDLKEIQESEEVYIKVVGYDKSGLRIKYRLPESGKELDAIARKVNREEKDTFARNLKIAMDTIIILCDGLYVQPEGVDEPVMLDPQELGYPMKFDERLAETMGWEGITSARQALRKLFDDNDIALITHAERLGRWIANTKANVEAELWELAGEA
jgi:hypothetical protein